MQTFLPYPDIIQSVRCLDPKRLGNQVYREALTLVRGGWPNHPAAKMWVGYYHALARYALAGLEELKRRGRYYPHHFDTFQSFCVGELIFPPWMGNPVFHASHRSALLFKNYEWYSQFGWAEKPAIPNYKGSLPYFWPV